jgi:hypothetical protein
VFVKRLARPVNKNTPELTNLSLKNEREINMFNQYTKQSDALERFRVKAHLRTYVKDPVIIDEQLLLEAVKKLKKLPYTNKDPADTVAIELLMEAYRLGFMKYENLTDSGHMLVQSSKKRRYRCANSMVRHVQPPSNRYTLKTI